MLNRLLIGLSDLDELRLAKKTAHNLQPCRQVPMGKPHGDIEPRQAGTLTASSTVRAMGPPGAFEPSPPPLPLPLGLYPPHGPPFPPGSPALS